MTLQALVLLLASLPAPARAVTPLVFHSSASFNSGGVQTDQAFAVAVDSQANVYVAGTANGGDFQLVKYDKRLSQLGAATFNAGGTEKALAVAVGPSGEVVMAGDDATRMLVVKYDASLTLVSSATFAAPSSTLDRARALAIDSAGRVVVCGDGQVGGQLKLSLVRFSPGLAVLSSALFDAGGLGATGFGVALDPTGNVFATGFNPQAGGDFWTVKYDPALSTILNQSNLDLGQTDQARAIAVDATGRVAVVGHSVNTGAGTADVVTARYDSSLVFAASAAVSTGGLMAGSGVAFDPSGNVVVAGSTEQGGSSSILGARYSPSLALISSSSLANAVSDHGNAAGVDSVGNVFVAGDTTDGASNVDMTTVRFMGAPQIATVGQVQQGGDQVAGQDIIVTGDNFVLPTGSSVTTTADGLRIRGAAADSLQQLRFNVIASTTVPIGKHPLTIRNPDGSSTTATTALEVVFRQTINSAAPQVAELTGVGGVIRLTIPANAFGANFDLTVASPAAVPASFSLIPTGLYFETAEAPDPGAPIQDVTVEMSYRPSDGLVNDPETFVVGYYDSTTLQWVALPSTRNPAQRIVSAPSRHFTLYGLFSEPRSGEGSQVLVIPNPYKPGSGGPYDDPPGGQGILFRNLPSYFQLKVYDVLGRPVYERAGDSVAGKFRWDTLDSSGRKVPSGVYFVLVNRADGGTVAKGKFSIIR